MRIAYGLKFTSSVSKNSKNNQHFYNSLSVNDRLLGLKKNALKKVRKSYAI